MGVFLPASPEEARSAPNVIFPEATSGSTPTPGPAPIEGAGRAFHLGWGVALADTPIGSGRFRRVRWPVGVLRDPTAGVGVQDDFVG
jgi:hypothetical protein